MLGRRRIDTATPIRSSLADAAFAVEERVVWGGADVLRRVFDAVKWPFERAAWAIERGLLWPLQERSGKWSVPVRAFGAIAIALLAVAAGALGLVLTSGSGSSPTAGKVAAPASTPALRQVVKAAQEPAAPVLQGAKPDFSAEADGGVAAGPAEIAGSSGSAGTANSTAEVASSGTAGSSGGGAATSEVVGPAASKVAHQFAAAFLLFETGRDTAEVRSVFGETATPQLAHSLLRRPPRLPAGVKVPKAKVLNVVPGPQHGDTYTLSVSLLRVGITSELRLALQCDPKTKKCLVEDVLG
jgi:hypothetical protein